MAKILIVDDDRSHRRILEYIVTEDGHHTQTAGSVREALITLERDDFDLILTDVRMPGKDGFELLREVRLRTSPPRVIMVTGFGSIGSAVDAMRAGAFDYITKPVDRERVRVAVGKALGSRDTGKPGVETIIGDSCAMRRVFRLIERVADSDAPVLITGESGTGKELVAKALHYGGNRAKGPLISINCAAIPKYLLESELFGHIKGAFTGAVCDKKGKFEEADGGTVFLDEIGEMSIDLQAKMLRVLQEMEVTRVGSSKTTTVNLRVISASNRDLEASIRMGMFREDLYYRLAVVPIHMPSLRERRSDIPLLVDHFLKKLSQGQEIQMTPEAVEVLSQHLWKGNVRELENAIERLIILREGNIIGLNDLPSSVLTGMDGREAGRFGTEVLEEGMGLQEAEIILIREALRRAEGNCSCAARLLKIPRHVLSYRMQKYEIK